MKLGSNFAPLPMAPISARDGDFNDALIEGDIDTRGQLTPKAAPGVWARGGSGE
jgi:hypothetical protein